MILLRLAGQWLYQLQSWDTLPSQFDRPTWLDIGFIVADWGGILFLLALVLGGLGVRRMGNGRDGGTLLLRETMVIALVLIVAYVVAVWAMTGKPN